MRLPCLLAGVAAAASSACGSTSHAGFLLVTVDARPAVHDAASITVTLANAGTMRTDTLMLGGKAFPVTFSVSTPGRTGDLAIAVDASDASGLVIGHGSAMTTVAAASAEVMLDSTDFVVNTDYAGDQFPTDDFQGPATGFQLAALHDGTWTTVFRDDCKMQSACNVFARRFDRAGKPVTTQAAAGTNAFVVTASATTDVTTPAIASSQDATIAMWNASDPVDATASTVACRTIDASGRLGANQVVVAAEAGFTPSVAAIDGGNFAAIWRTEITTATDILDTIHMTLVKPDCTPVGAVLKLDQGAKTADFVHRDSVASSAGQVLFAWITNGDLRTTVMSSGGTQSPVTTLIPQTPTLEVEHARVAAVPGGGFVIAVSWTLKTGTGAGRVDLFRVDTAGKLAGDPVRVTDQSDGDPFNAEGFGLASRSDGSMMIAWHVCNSTGDSCALSGRMFQLPADPGTAPFPVTDAFAIPTTTGGSDKRASVVGLPDAFAVVWSDSSMKPPDTSGQAVRARIIYPPGS
jgi:hypothetical protein